MLTDVESVELSLLGGNYTQVMNSLHQLGRQLKKKWDDNALQTQRQEKYKFTANVEFKIFLIDELKKTNDNLVNDNLVLDQTHTKECKNKLYRLALFLSVWKDGAILSEVDPTINRKLLRQQIKFKSSLDKSDRYAINIALQYMVFILCQQYNNIISNPNNLKWKNSIDEFRSLTSKAQLIDFLFKYINAIDNSACHADRNFQIKKDTLNIKQEIEKIGLAISAFQTPNKKKKLLKYFGITLAVIAALASGLLTGGSIFLLFPHLPALGFSLGAVICIWGFTANYGFFSQNFPNFLISLLKKDTFSKFYNKEGNSQQLSAIKKYLFIPLAVLTSLTVGIGTIGLTYTTLIALVAKILPMLTLLWPPLPLIIVGILSIAVGITLTVAVLTAAINAIQNSQNFSWIQFKEKLKNATIRDIVSYIFKGLLVLLGLFGLAYFRYSVGIDLTNLLQSLNLTGSAATIISAVIGMIACIPQTFFTVISIQKLIRVFSPTPQQTVSVEDEQVSPSKSFFSRLSTIYTWVALIGNAIGNAALVIVDSVSAWSISGAIGNFFNSLSGNLVESNGNLSYRNKANVALAKEFNTMSISTKEKTPPIKMTSDAINIKQPTEPREPNDLTEKNLSLATVSRKNFFKLSFNSLPDNLPQQKDTCSSCPISFKAKI